MKNTSNYQHYEWINPTLLWVNHREICQQTLNFRLKSMKSLVIQSRNFRIKNGDVGDVYKTLGLRHNIIFEGIVRREVAIFGESC